jgi:hypothetical protein
MLASTISSDYQVVNLYGQGGVLRTKLTIGKDKSAHEFSFNIKRKLLRLEELVVIASLRRHNPDQVRGSRTLVLLSANMQLPVLF